MREFKVLRPAAEKLQVKSEDLEAVGEPFAPEFVYEVIRKLKSFAHMRVSSMPLNIITRGLG